MTNKMMIYNLFITTKNVYLESCPNVSAVTPEKTPHPMAKAKLMNTELLNSNWKKHCIVLKIITWSIWQELKNINH